MWIEITIAPAHRTDTTSPSVRKVWIEMISSSDTWKNSFVTFRKEGVDWNYRIGERRGANQVTFRKEGVDWNKIMSRSKYDSLSHLPQGRCGLKLCVLIVSSSHMCHLPQGRCGLKFPSTNIDCNGQPCHLPQGRCGLKLFRHWKRALHSPGHLPQGRCGFNMFRHWMRALHSQGHLPQGRCGLKLKVF